MRAPWIERPRLLTWLQQAVEIGHVMVDAPAGFGKSILLEQLTLTRPDTYHIYLQPEEIDLPALQARLKPLLQKKTTILLDDIHLLAEGPEAVVWLLQQLQTSWPRWVLSGRFLPSTLLTSGQLQHLSAEELAFSYEETSRLLAEKRFAAATVRRWHTTLEGWSLGLGLLRQLPTRMEADTLGDTDLFGHLAESVFGSLDERLRDFLFLSTVPRRFNLALLSHLTDGSWPDLDDLRRLAQTRNLFLFADDEPGWYRFHALIRAYLRRHQPQRLDLTRKAAAWLIEAGKEAEAIELFLEDGLFEEAADYLEALPLNFLYAQNRYLLFRRWVRALPAKLQADHPLLVARMGYLLSLLPGHAQEAKQAVRQGIVLAEQAGLRDTFYEATIYEIVLQLNQQEIDAALIDKLYGYLADPEFPTEKRHHLYGGLVISLAATQRWREAERVVAEAVATAQEVGDVSGVWNMRRILMTDILPPLGRLQEAAMLQAAVIDHFADSPSWLMLCLADALPLWDLRADWPRHRSLLAQLETLADTVQDVEDHVRRWTPFHQAVQALATGRWANAAAAIVRFENAGGEANPLAMLKIRLAQRQGDYRHALTLATAALEATTASDRSTAWLALELDTANALAFVTGEISQFKLQPQTAALLSQRDRPALLRLRQLLAIACYQVQSPRWQRHLHAAVVAARRPGYEMTLLHAQPQIARHFWRIAWQEGVHLDSAAKALVELGHWETVAPCLRMDNAELRLRTAILLGEIGDERTLPVIASALQETSSKPIRAALFTVQSRLEAQPPPRLTIRLLGPFQLWRGDQPIAATAWPRPVVLRLFQYLALNAGRVVPRDQMLEALWPDTTPARAKSAFRSTVSKLNKVLEPYVRSKGPNRYLQLEADSLLFGADETVTVDAHHRRDALRSTLRQQDRTTLPELPDSFLAALQDHQPLLPELPYAEWLLAARQELLDLHQEGCLYAAQVYLQRNEPEKAIQWAQQAITVAPWLEEAYQVLMRAYARQGQRSLAIKVYHDALTALADELDLPPSPLTQWLLERLRSGERI